MQLTNRQIDALRACLLYPQGMRHRAYPPAMPALEALGYVVSRPAQGPGRKIPTWFITPAGREVLAALETGSRRNRPGEKRIFRTKRP